MKRKASVRVNALFFSCISFTIGHACISEVAEVVQLCIFLKSTETLMMQIYTIIS